MKPITHLQWLTLALALICGAPGPAVAGSLPDEPGDEHLVKEDVNTFLGFYVREYSLARNGTIDYRTARQVLLSGQDDPQNTAVEAEEYPLFYWYDHDQDGNFEMWVDRKVQGCACDIVRYDPQVAQR